MLQLTYNRMLVRRLYTTYAHLDDSISSSNWGMIMKFGSKIVAGTIALAVTSSAFASISDAPVQAVPELDGALAFLAVGLVASLIAIIKEKRRS